MSLEIIFFIGLIFLGLASITDIRRKEVPEVISLSFIIFGLGLNFYFILEYGLQKSEVISFAILGGVTIITYLLYITRQWGGADVKIMLGIGLLFILKTGYFYILFLLNFLIIGAIYGILGTFFTFLEHFKIFKNEFQELKKHKKILLTSYFILPFFILFKSVFLGVLTFLLVLFYFLTNFKNSFIKAMTHTRSVDKLVDGEWIKHDIKHEGKKIIDYEKKKMLSSDDIKLLEKKGVKEIEIIEGFAFVPGILLSYCISLVYSNFGWRVLEKMVTVLAF